MMSMLMRTGSLFFLMAWFAAAEAMAQPEPIDLGTLGGDWSRPRDVNDRGEIVGSSPVSSSFMAP